MNTTEEITRKLFRKRFDKLRGNRSNTDFAEFLDISRQTVGFYLNGNRMPDANQLVKIASKCGVTTDYLLGLADIPTTDMNARGASEYTGLHIHIIECLAQLNNNENSIQLESLNNIMLHNHFGKMLDSLSNLACSVLEAEYYIENDFGKKERANSPLRHLYNSSEEHDLSDDSEETYNIYNDLKYSQSKFLNDCDQLVNEVYGISEIESQMLHHLSSINEQLKEIGIRTDFGLANKIWGGMEDAIDKTKDN